MNKQHETSEKPAFEQQRLDLWLYISRFYKTRKLASVAVTAGHVKVNRSKGKPGKLVRVGDNLTIRKNQQNYAVQISAFAAKRPGATLAQTLYAETESSKNLRLQQQELAKYNHAGLRFSQSKPDKHNRRRLVEVKQQL